MDDALVAISADLYREVTLVAFRLNMTPRKLIAELIDQGLEVIADETLEALMGFGPPLAIVEHNIPNKETLN